MKGIGMIRELHQVGPDLKNHQEESWKMLLRGPGKTEIKVNIGLTKF
jgi:hypothetical protein